MTVVALYSGGLDSTAMIYELLRTGHEVEALSFNYGQRHSRELNSAKTICSGLAMPHAILDVGKAFAFLSGSSSLLDPDIPVPEGHYASEPMKATVVPNRNMILLSFAIGRAVATGASSVAFAAHAGDHTIYPDCRPVFATVMKAAARVSNWKPVTIMHPFLTWSKADIVRRAAAIGVPFAETWSCYKGGKIHCGRCGACVERIESFETAQVKDPTSYETR